MSRNRVKRPCLVTQGCQAFVDEMATETAKGDGNIIIHIENRTKSPRSSKPKKPVSKAKKNRRPSKKHRPQNASSAAEKDLKVVERRVAVVPGAPEAAERTRSFRHLFSFGRADDAARSVGGEEGTKSTRARDKAVGTGKGFSLLGDAGAGDAGDRNAGDDGEAKRDVSGLTPAELAREQHRLAVNALSRRSTARRTGQEVMERDASYADENPRFDNDQHGGQQEHFGHFTHEAPRVARVQDMVARPTEEVPREVEEDPTEVLAMAKSFCRGTRTLAEIEEEWFKDGEGRQAQVRRDFKLKRQKRVRGRQLGLGN